MNKTATMTFSNSYNYGAVFQMYALQKSIVLAGYENKVINYKDRVQMKYYDIIDVSDIRSFLKSLFFSVNTFLRRRAFRKFIDNNIDMTLALKKEELCTLEKEYDAFIVGSDQVWNTSLIENDGSYFLDFIKTKPKFSFAASLGVANADDEAIKNYKSWLNSYESISVREETGKLVLEKILKSKVMVDMDPVFLLERDKWMKFISLNDNKKYVLAYLTDQKGLEFAKELAKKRNARLIHPVYIQEISLFHPKSNIGECMLNVSPEEWLSLIFNAECVVTGSFHAVAFSLLFHKNFYIKFCNKGTSRITDLLARLKLDDDVCWNMCDVFSFTNLNWDLIDAEVTTLRQRSIDNIKNYLKCSYAGK